MLPTGDSRWPARRNSCSWLICHLNGAGSLMFYRLQKAVTSMNCEPRRTRRQIKVLQALDLAKTQWYHFTAVVITGMGFFTDAYDLFCISLVTDLLGRIYYHNTASDDKPGSLPSSVAAAVKGIALCGTMFGQLIFGTLGDNMGRKRIYGVTLILMVVCSIASGLSFHDTPGTVITTLCFFRFWLGFGIGGDYPLSGAIMSEYANKNTRGAFMAAVFAMQGLGNLAAGIIVLIVSASFMHTPAYKTDMLSQADYVWRIVLMIGAIPALVTFYWRMRMPETARYTALIARNLKQAVSDMNLVLDIDIDDLTEEEDANILAKQDNFGLLSSMFMCRHGWHLVSTTVCWFMLDVVFYSLNLFMIEIFTTGTNWFGDASKEGILEQTNKIAKTQAIIAVSGTLPGYFLTVLFVDRIGRMKIQLMGFTMMTIFILGLAGTYNFRKNTESLPIGFAVMYGFIFFFANFGPNSTTFIVPTEIFPTRLRSTCHGISGAGGKAGAIVGVLLFLHAGRSIPLKLLILASCNLVGIMFTLFLPECKGMSLEEIAGDIQEDGECDSQQRYVLDQWS